ncbi:MAG: ABC transporter permease [Bacteroidetes bacterium]|nr:ABC transporter permease [Bacteroidota bacterium]
MRWYFIFTKGIREQLRDYWILVMILVMTPVFIAIYFLMSIPGEASYEVIIVNQDKGFIHQGVKVNLGDSLLSALQSEAAETDYAHMVCTGSKDRGTALEQLRKNRAEVVVVVPGNLSESLRGQSTAPAELELVGDVSDMGYIIGAIWAEELISKFMLESAGISPPVTWTETTLGHSGSRSEFELYVPGLLILSIIMIIFSTSAAIVREPEARTLERLKISRLTSFEFLGGISLVQIIIAILSLGLALLTAMSLGYSLIPGSLGFILLIAFLTALSMISFSLIVAAMCRSIKEVAIIGTFPLFLLMFFTGAAFPISGGKLFSVGDVDFMLNHILSPTWAIEALNKVLVTGLGIREALPEIAAILVLTVLYALFGTWAFRRRHMRAG